MARGRQIVCLMLIYFVIKQQVSAAAVFANAKTAVETGIIVRDNINYIRNVLTGESLPGDNIRSKNVHMFSTLNNIDRDVIFWTEQLFQKLPYDLVSKLDLKFHNLTDKIEKVNINYQAFMQIVDNLQKYNIKTVRKFFQTAVSPSLVELPTVVEQMHTSLYKPDSQSATLLSTIASGTEHSRMCGRSQSSQQILNELFKTVVNADAKSLAVRIFAHAINQKLDNASYTHEALQELTNFQRRVESTYSYVADAMKIASRDVWRCDPMTLINGRQQINHQKGKTYSTLQEIFQSVFIFESDIKKSCDGQCGSLSNVENACQSKFCKNQKKQCSFRLDGDVSRGIIRECMDMSNHIDVCYAANDSERQYDWAKTNNDLIYGRDRDTCRNKMVKFDWEYPKYGDLDNSLAGPLQRCNYCLCTCEDMTPARTRYFSLRTTTSDKRANKVVTGVRFRKIGLVYYIQIQQGKLGPNGQIKSTNWQTVGYPFSNEYITKTVFYKDKENLPVYQVSWETKTVYLDEHIDNKRPNTILTGLRFKKVGRDLRLEAELTEFNFATGILGKSRWHFNDAKREKRTAVILDDADDPARHINNAVYSKPGSYVQFQRTNIVKDMGQLTVPFLEMQDVVSDPPVPIVGISLFLKATQGSGGFLAFKLTQYDYRHHV